jgi:hypothetical protein
MPPDDSNELRRLLDACPAGVAGWVEFEKVGLAVLSFLFVPPLRPPKIQPRTLAGVERRDAVFPLVNRERDVRSNWGLLYADHEARMVAVEFKDYDELEISSDLDP